jgi:multidrug/hemolysin transport system permease protein
MLSVQDKANGTIKDLTIAPVPLHTLSISYYAATFVATITVCLVATVVCFVYTAIVGWFMSFADVLLLLLDIFLLVMLGTALSGLVCHFLSSQGQISAVGSIVSSCYGFISGAYMPISQFSEGIRRFVSFIPGTYGTVLFRKFYMRGTMEELANIGMPQEAITVAKDGFDANFYG